MIIAFFRKREIEESGTDEDGIYREEIRRKRMPLRIGMLILGVIAIILFILTEDMTLPMIFIDSWTIWHVIIAVVQAVFMIVTTRRKTVEEELEPTEEYVAVR